MSFKKYLLESLSLKWSSEELLLLDQSLLPHSEVWISVTSPEQMVTCVHQLQVRGAPLIGVASALCLANYAFQGASYSEFSEALNKLRAARPTAVNLMWALDRMHKLAEYSSYDKSKLVNEAMQIFIEDKMMCDRIAEQGASFLSEGDQVLTHCNTGGLATAGVGTALGVIRKAHEQGKKIHVFVDETRPLLQGGRLTTWELDRLEIPYTLICDNMAATLMAQKKIDKVIVGADRIAANGDFANKVGTYSCAVNARFHNIGFYVAAPMSTFDAECASGDRIPIEQRSEAEVRGVKGSFGEVTWAPLSGEVYNPAFDVTPAHLVSAWIFDVGIWTQKNFR